MRECGLLSKHAIRQIQSDVVTIEALSRLQASEFQSLPQEAEEIKQTGERNPDELYEDILIESRDEKPGRLSEDVRNYNKEKNHFSKSTAEESDIGVREIENLLAEKQTGKNNRASGSVGDIGF